PKPYADYVILDILKRSGGTAVSATDEEMMEAVREWASNEGVFAAPEGAASLVACRKLRASGFLKTSDRVVLFNTGSGLKYIDVFHRYWKEQSAKGSSEPKRRQIGGIIQPY